MSSHSIIIYTLFRCKNLNFQILFWENILLWTLYRFITRSQFAEVNENLYMMYEYSVFSINKKIVHFLTEEIILIIE